MLLVLSICGWLVCAILSPITWLMARGDLKQMDEGLMDPSGADTTRTAKLIAMIHCIVCIVALVVGGLLFLILAIGFVVTPNVVGRSEEGNRDLTRINIAAFEQAAQMYKITNKAWPEGQTEDVVMLLMMTEDDKGQPRAAYLEKIPMDAWGEPLQYEYPAEKTGKPLIWSSGPDKQEGTDDDITNILSGRRRHAQERSAAGTAVKKTNRASSGPVGTEKPMITQSKEKGRSGGDATPQTGVAEKLKKLDKNRDGFIDRSEAGPLIREKFTALDKNGDGRLSRQELKQVLVKLKRRKK